MKDANMWKRRGLIFAGAAAVVATAGLRRLRWPGSAALEYRDLPGLEPFRELVSNGGISTASVAFVGLEPNLSNENDGTLEDRVAWVRNNLCEALFGQVLTDGTTPIAYFSDFNCPYCRVLEKELAELAEDQDLPISIVRHQLPLLGGASLDAAKAVLAAQRQGGYEALSARLMQAGLITNEPYIRSVAESLELDPDLLLADMRSPEISDMILTSQALAWVFGFFGTPALVVYRTTILGSVTANTIRQVIADEQDTQRPACDVS